MKKPFFFVSAIVMVMLLSGCLKDRLTHIIEGTYTVSGIRIQAGMVPDGLGGTVYAEDSSSITNASIEIDKKNKEEVEAVFLLPDAQEFTLSYQEQASSDEMYLFGGSRMIDGGIRTAQFWVFANDRDSVYVHYFLQDSLNNTVNYRLSGRKN